MIHSVSERQIVQYYDTCESDYRLLWHLDRHLAMHYGYWDGGTRLLREALVNMNSYVSAKLALSAGERVLDAGCGVGGSAIYIARRWPVEVRGITLSEKQAARATKHADRTKLAGSAHFSVANYCRTPFPQASFDVVYGIESICHANDKAEFLREAARVLNDGGRLIVADFFRSGKAVTPAEDREMLLWARSWAVPDFVRWDDFIRDAADSGLELEVNENITANVERTARRLYQFFFPGLFCHSVLRLFGLRNRVHGRNLWSAYYQYRCLKRNAWEYRVLRFRKKSVA